MVEPLPTWARVLVGVVAVVGLVGIVVAVWPDDGVSDSEILSATLLSETRLALAVGSCNATSIDVDTVESDVEVVITLRSHDDAATEDCADGTTVTLAEPLGDRTLVDGAADRALVCEQAPGARFVECLPGPEVADR